MREVHQSCRWTYGALHAALVLVPDTVVSAPEDIASKKRKSDEGSESAPRKSQDFPHLYLGRN